MGKGSKGVDVATRSLIVFLAFIFLFLALVMFLLGFDETMSKGYLFGGFLLLVLSLFSLNWAFSLSRLFGRLFRKREINMGKIKTIISTLVLIVMIVSISIIVLEAPRYIYIPGRGSFLVTDFKKAENTLKRKTRIDWETVTQHSIPVILIGGFILWICRKKKEKPT